MTTSSNDVTSADKETLTTDCPFTGTSWLLKPMNENTRTASFATPFNVNFPSTSVTVPPVDPLTSILTPGNGVLLSSRTCPLIVCCGGLPGDPPLLPAYASMHANTD